MAARIVAVVEVERNPAGFWNDSNDALGQGVSVAVAHSCKSHDCHLKSP